MAKSTIHYEISVRMTGELEKTDSLTLEELARHCECQEELIRRMVSFGLIEPIAGATQLLFRRTAVSRICRALRLKRDFGLNVDALALVMELLDRIDELEDSIRRG